MWVVLKGGGLYWWMAIEDAGDPKKLIKEMLKAGPSKWASCHGQVIAKLSSSCLVNDQFTPAALAVLGGVYQVETHRYTTRRWVMVAHERRMGSE